MSDDQENPEVPFSQYPPYLRPLLHKLSRGTFGVHDLPVQLEIPPQPSARSHLPFLKMIDVLIPYGDKPLKCQITFAECDIYASPDFRIINSAFLEDPDEDIIERDLNSLINWDIHNSNSLLRFIKQIRILYRKHHFDKLRSDSLYSRLIKELSELKEHFKLNSNHYEIYDNKDGQHVEISFDLNIPEHILHSYLPLDTRNPGSDRLVLRLSYKGSTAKAALVLSPLLKNLLPSYAIKDLPSPLDSDVSMKDYVAPLLTRIGNCVQGIGETFEKREAFMTRLLAEFNDFILEYDSMKFTKATLLFEDNDYACIILIELGHCFPMEMPTVILKSIDRLDDSGSPACVILRDFCYSSEWNSQSMIEKIVDHIRQTFNDMKNC